MDEEVQIILHNLRKQEKRVIVLHMFCQININISCEIYGGRTKVVIEFLIVQLRIKKNKR